ncbi:unnamed protein product, partial [Medioppia subpectinata]
MNPDRDVEIKYTKIFINNEFVDSVSGKTFETINPSNGRVITRLQEGDRHDIDKAVAAARNAFKRDSVWRKTDASKRGKLINKLADLIERDSHYLASLETIDSGKPYRGSLYDVLGSVAYLRYYAGWADKVCGKTIPVDGPNFAYSRLEPMGVCGFITPWNAEMLTLMSKLGPALATGNTVVVKPAEQVIHKSFITIYKIVNF